MSFKDNHIHRPQRLIGEALMNSAILYSANTAIIEKSTTYTSRKIKTDSTKLAYQ